MSETTWQHVGLLVRRAAEKLGARDGAQWQFVGLVRGFLGCALESEDSALEAGGVDTELDSLLTGAHVVVFVVETVVIWYLFDLNWLELLLIFLTHLTLIFLQNL